MQVLHILPWYLCIFTNMCLYTYQVCIYSFVYYYKYIRVFSIEKKFIVEVKRRQIFIWESLIVQHFIWSEITFTFCWFEAGYTQFFHAQRETKKSPLKEESFERNNPWPTKSYFKVCFFLQSVPEFVTSFHHSFNLNFRFSYY